MTWQFREAAKGGNKPGPLRWGGYATLKLWQRSLELGGVRVAELALLESQSQPGSAAKAAISLVRFCPTISMAPVLAIV